MSQIKTPLGFSQSVIDEDHLDITMIGVEGSLFGDLYHILIRMSWRVFVLWFVVAFLGFNLVFAGLYALDPSGLSTTNGEHIPLFWRSFFFSVHTVATIGYGNVYPLSIYANVLVVTEITIGILFFALISGLIFARFSRPTARILFSDKAIIKTFEGVPTLMFRVGNQRGNFILEASIRLSILRYEVVDGNRMRRFYDLPLVRANSPVFAMSWLVMHQIDETSPLFDKDALASLSAADEIVVILTGTDSSVIQAVHARYAYSSETVYIDHDFVDIISTDTHGRNVIDYRHFHDINPLSVA